jgi:hypothetical protein
MMASLNLFSEKYFSPLFQCFSLFASLLQANRPERMKKKRVRQTTFRHVAFEKFINVPSSIK